MKFVIIFSYLLFFISPLGAQGSKSFVEPWEVYGLKVQITEKLITARMKCGLGFLDGKKSTLYQIQVEDLLYTRDSSVYSKIELKQVKYVALPHSIELKDGQGYFLLAGNSSVADYVVGYRVFEKNKIQTMDNTDKHALFQGLEKCYQLNFIDRLRLFFGVEQPKVYTKLRDEQKRNKLYNFILGLE